MFVQPAILSLLATLAVATTAGASVRVISAPDCVDAGNFVKESDPAPPNATHMRVQHIGDPGTEELAGEVANVVTWDVGQVTGLQVDPASFARTQRGYRDQGLPTPASAFQLACSGAGFFIDSRRLAHAAPVVLEGPSASVARDLSPGAHVFRSGTSALTIDATIRVPVMQVDALPVIDGTAQVSFVYYVQDTTTGQVFPHVIQLYDNRGPGVNGAGTEAVSADISSPFVVSPLHPVTGDGQVTQFVTAGTASALLQYAAPWTEPRPFRAHVSYDQFAALLQRLIRDALPAISPRPQDYRVLLFGVLGEIFPGTGPAHEVSLGASVTDLTLAETYVDVAPVTVVEFHHEELDHYFMSSREDEIDALDSGRIAGWRRTGATTAAWPVFVEGAAAVCRYYLPPAFGDSHFFSASAQECRATASRFPAFVLEDAQVMYVREPEAATGDCPADSTPVYRLWNARRSTNHRYTPDKATRDGMVAQGWISEGAGPFGVGWCAPRSVSGAAART